TKELLFTPDPEKIIRENRNARKLALQQSQQTHKPWDPRPMGDDQMKGNAQSTNPNTNDTRRNVFTGMQGNKECGASPWDPIYQFFEECKKERGPVDVELRYRQNIVVAELAQKILRSEIEQCEEVASKLKKPSQVEGLLIKIAHSFVEDINKIRIAALDQDAKIKSLEHQVEQLTNLIETLEERAKRNDKEECASLDSKLKRWIGKFRKVKPKQTTKREKCFRIQLREQGIVEPPVRVTAPIFDQPDVGEDTIEAFQTARTLTRWQDKQKLRMKNMLWGRKRSTGHKRAGKNTKLTYIIQMKSRIREKHQKRIVRGYMNSRAWSLLIKERTEWCRYCADGNYAKCKRKGVEGETQGDDKRTYPPQWRGKCFKLMRR
ncbi:hypothetical protein A2U01_0007691, partial [Trifolium medium]|nr:hypothetical protein [Trifolium medium]